MSEFREGEKVKINPNVYHFKWEGWEQLFNKFWHNELIVDRIVDLSDINEGEWVIVKRFTDKAKVKPSYLWSVDFSQK